MNKMFLSLVFFVVFVLSCAEKKESTDSGNPVVVKEILKSEKSWDGTTIPPQDIKNPQITVLHITIKEGTKLSLHKHPILNVGYMVKGTLTVHKESGEKVVLNKGDSLVEVINQWHYGENSGTEEVVIVVFYVGEKDQALTIFKIKLIFLFHLSLFLNKRSIFINDKF